MARKASSLCVGKTDNLVIMFKKKGQNGKKTHKERTGKTRVGKFLEEIGSPIAGTVLDIAGDITGVEALSKLGKKIENSNEIPAHEREIALELLKMDMHEATEITKRWEADMSSDNIFSKNIRPFLVGIFSLSFIFFMFLEGLNVGFSIPEHYVPLHFQILMLAIGAYFGARTYEKYVNRKTQ